MQACELDCEHASIPMRLHSKGRPFVARLSDEGHLYMFYPSMPEDQEFDCKFKYRGSNQSVVADELNAGGSPVDVFWDTNTGNRLVDFMAVCLPVVEVRGVTYPDKRVTRRDPRTHQILEPLP